MKSFFEEYSRFIGLISLVFVIIILFSSPSLLLGKSITTIDTELSHASGDATPVRARMDFGSNEHMRAFPHLISNWNGADYNTTRVAESLGADVMLSRTYINPKFYQSVYFLIVQSENRSSFHPPIVCYPALGYKIEGEGKERIAVHDVSWVEKPLFTVPESRKEEFSGFNGTISVKRLVVTKESGGRVTERRVVLYFYVKGNPLASAASDTVTMVRASALVPLGASYDEILDMTKEFMGESVPHLFEFRPEGDIIIVSLVKLGIVGWFLTVVLLGLPLLVILYPKLRKGNG